MATQPRGCKEPDVRIQAAIDLIGSNRDKPVGVPDLARAVGLSISYFSHLFRDNVGVSPAKFLRDFRMRQAEHLVRTTTYRCGPYFRWSALPTVVISCVSLHNAMV